MAEDLKWVPFYIVLLRYMPTFQKVLIGIICPLQTITKSSEAGSPYWFTGGLNKGFSLHVYTDTCLCLTRCVGSFGLQTQGPFVV